jgi:hypothetical protein
MTLAGAYTRPANRSGQFIVSITNRVFMMPDSRGKTEKGLKDFTTFGTDVTRPVDFPGGDQPAQVGAFDITLQKGDGYTGGSTNVRFAPGAVPQPDETLHFNVGKVNTVDNSGVIFLRHI